MLEVARADPDGRDVDEVLRRLAETNERSIALIEALLTLAALDHVDLPSTVVDIDQLVVSVVAEAEAAGPEVTVETTLQGGAVRGDATLLRQLVTNLVQNAVLHNRSDGTVELATTRQLGSVTLEVTNTGDELEQAVVETLTEPFVRGAGRGRRPSSAGGSGLGLAIVSSIVRAHGGSLHLEARDGGGLTVRAVIPTGVSPAYAIQPTER